MQRNSNSDPTPIRTQGGSGYKCSGKGVRAWRWRLLTEVQGGDERQQQGHPAAQWRQTAFGRPNPTKTPTYPSQPRMHASASAVEVDSLGLHVAVRVGASTDTD